MLLTEYEGLNRVPKGSTTPAYTAQSPGLETLRAVRLQEIGLIQVDLDTTTVLGSVLKNTALPGHTVSCSHYPVGGDNSSSTAMGACDLQADLPRPGPQRGRFASSGSG